MSSVSFALALRPSSSRPRGPNVTFAFACVATAPAPASAQGTTLPTLKNREATATPTSPVTGSRATIENVATDDWQLSPSWSPDGGWVAFTSENASGQPLLIARADGSEIKAVPGGFRYSGQPEWGNESE
jgi:hypothetical protein